MMINLNFEEAGVMLVFGKIPENMMCAHSVDANQGNLLVANGC
jgi:hypothetical protein